MTMAPQLVASVIVPAPGLAGSTGGALGQFRLSARVAIGGAQSSALVEAVALGVGAAGEAPMALASALAAAWACAGSAGVSVDRPSTNQVAPAPTKTTTTAAATIRC